MNQECRSGMDCKYPSFGSGSGASSWLRKSRDNPQNQMYDDMNYKHVPSMRV